MTIYIDNHGYSYEMEKLVRLFFPNDKLTATEEIPTERSVPYIYTAVRDNGEVTVRIKTEDFDKALTRPVQDLSDDKAKNPERTMSFELYELLVELTGMKQYWGILTGVRPIKLFRRIAEVHGAEYAKQYFEKNFLVSEEKAELSRITESYETKILSLNTDESFSLYISIPFCPSRCSYCSFVSQSIERAEKLIEPYLDLLCKEIAFTAEVAKKSHLRLESVYIGGGTPTTLNAEQLKKLIQAVYDSFDMSACREFTIEAGRPDTIDESKLTAILEGGVDRISINPQTLNDEILKAVGRRHTSEQTIEAFELARKVGFKHINMDLIAGLPNESVDSFVRTLDRLCELAPESITVHTLALKRSSNMTKQGKQVDSNGDTPAVGMLKYCEKKLTECGYHPYYLYRQSRMESNLENVGWSKDGFDGLYNVFVMDETHTILGCGAGAVSKLKSPHSDDLVRIFNYKYPYEYINGFDEMLKRKEQVTAFYDQLS